MNKNCGIFFLFVIFFVAFFAVAFTLRDELEFKYSKKLQYSIESFDHFFFILCIFQVPTQRNASILHNVQNALSTYFTALVSYRRTTKNQTNTNLYNSRNMHTKTHTHTYTNTSHSGNIKKINKPNKIKYLFLAR